VVPFAPARAYKDMGTLFSLSKSATSTALDISEVALLLFGILLVVGLIGEYAKSERWKKHVKTFEMLVIIGVAGELFADGGIFLFSGHLQTIADLEIAELTKEAGQAKERVAVLEQGIANANAEMAKQQTRAAEAERSLLVLQEKIRPRHLSAQQKEAIKNALKGFPPQQVNIFAVVGTPDGTIFGLELADAINSSGWKASFLGQESSGGELRGIALVVRDAKHPPSGTQQLQNALKAAGLPAPMWNHAHWQGSESAIALFVAPREM